MLCCCKQNAVYELRMSDRSSAVCSSDLLDAHRQLPQHALDMPHQSGGLTVVVEHRLALVAKAGMMRIDCDTILGNEEALPREIERLEPIDRTQIGRASCRERGCQYV